MFMILNVEGVLQRINAEDFSVLELIELQNKYHFNVVSYSNH